MFGKWCLGYFPFHLARKGDDMAKWYEVYLKKKGEEEKKLYLFSRGAFYIMLDQDAKKVSEELGLKQTKYSGDIIKCGFPKTEWNKYKKFFDLLHFDYEMVMDDVEVIRQELKTLNIEECSEIELREKVKRWKELYCGNDEL